MKAKSFLKWAGGKTQLLPEIFKRLPSFILDGENFNYYEPFVGSGAVLFAFLHHFSNMKKVVINDKNAQLINLYRQVQENHILLISRLSEIQTAYFGLDALAREEYFYSTRAEFNSFTMSKLDEAAAMLFLNRTCFNGLFRVNKSGHFNVPFGRYVNPIICDVANLCNVSKALQNVEILNLDYSEIPITNSNNNFVYFDPPYKPLSSTSNFNSYDISVFNDSEQCRLQSYCTALNELGVHWLLSNSDPKNNNPDNIYFDELYKSFQIDRVFAKRMINSVASKRGNINELLIYNYKITNDTLFQP